MRIRRKSKGFMIVSAALTAMVFILLASSLLGLYSGMFSALESGQTASVAQQYAEIDANTLTLLPYDELVAAAHGRANIAGADGWQSEVIIGSEKAIGDDNRQRIGTVKIYKAGEGVARSSLQVPLSSKEGNSSVPVGTVIWFAASTPPKGFLECNGQSVNAYPKLAAIVGNTVPDLRGTFIRGWDHGRGIDINRTILSYQNDAFQGHNHRFPMNADISGESWQDHWWNGETLGGSNLNQAGRWTTGGVIVPDEVNGTPRFSSETRPTNVALLPCIKHD